jgi:hypothetical protein
VSSTVTTSVAQYLVNLGISQTWSAWICTWITSPVQYQIHWGIYWSYDSCKMLHSFNTAFLLMISPGFWDIIIGYIQNSWLVSLTFQPHCLKAEIVISILMDTDKLLSIGKTQPPSFIGSHCSNLIFKVWTAVLTNREWHHLNSLPAHWISREAEHMCALMKIILFD